jgi:hypothetical protein
MVANKVPPMYRRYDSQAECYRRPTIREMPTPRNPMKPTVIPTALYPELQEESKS